VADLACTTALSAFHSRCWSNGSLMLTTIGMDHAAAVAKRFYPGRERAGLARRVADWVRRVNGDTIDLLEQVVELSAAAGGRTDAGFRRQLRALTERECALREQSVAEGARLRLELASLRTAPARVSWARMARQAAAALLALGVPSAALAPPAIAQESQTSPTAATPTPGKGACSLTGKITDPSSAEIPKAKITITNESTGAVRKTTTDESGTYVVNGLAAGLYTVRVESLGFRTAVRTRIALQAGNCERINVSLGLEVGMCEVVAVELPARTTPTENLYEKKKPFNYVVGDQKDGGTLKGVAKLVYGDPNAWVQIFEANRAVLLYPGPVGYGTVLYIPAGKRRVPKLISKVLPVYPPSTAPGDVVLDVTLAADGAVKDVQTVDGDPVLADAAVPAVKQWRYRPLTVKGKAVDHFVVVVSFGRNGKVRTL